MIALKEGDYDHLNAFKDTLLLMMETQNSANCAAKDSYYSKLIGKEKLRINAQNENRRKTDIIITIIIISVIVVIFILCLSHYRRKQIQIQNTEQQKRKQLTIEHQRIQILTMRNYLMSKISILHKLESIKTGSGKPVLLSDSDWDELEAFLNSSDDTFVERIKREFPELTKKDIRFLMLIRIRLPYPVIAHIYNIEPKSVKQKLFLIKDKLGLKNSPKSAKDFIQSY